MTAIWWQIESCGGPLQILTLASNRLNFYYITLKIMAVEFLRMAAVQSSSIEA